MIRLSLGVFVLLFGIWYCYKRGREERIKLGVEEDKPEIVEGSKPPDGGEERGDGTRDQESPDGLQTRSRLRDTSTKMVSVDDNTDTPLQVERDPIPKSSEKAKKVWFRRR
jgi:hypothetical protein